MAYQFLVGHFVVDAIVEEFASIDEGIANHFLLQITDHRAQQYRRNKKQPVAAKLEIDILYFKGLIL